jgi:hypothetical protein
MAFILLRRKAALWADRFRDYEILVDGEPAGAIGNGGEIRIPVPPGRHTVRMKIDWAWSPEVTVEAEAGTERVLACGPNAHPLLVLLYITVLAKHYLWLRDSGARALLPAA